MLESVSELVLSFFSHRGCKIEDTSKVMRQKLFFSMHPTNQEKSLSSLHQTDVFLKLSHNLSLLFISLRQVC